ncbi:hypothetical protein PoB_003586700 [Plakobranchus ocellatus]|uniref:Uncharacterized protein n=1 Tax=Plakobranchus ocellatus TaxID=259542 RepID=A0AAV4AR01_9GAST|nr:hypothetical protein PoB_003586700 [Plakobranchus ocellatus]
MHGSNMSACKAQALAVLNRWTDRRPGSPLPPSLSSSSLYSSSSSSLPPGVCQSRARDACKAASSSKGGGGSRKGLVEDEGEEMCVFVPYACIALQRHGDLRLCWPSPSQGIGSGPEPEPETERSIQISLTEDFVNLAASSRKGLV